MKLYIPEIGDIIVLTKDWTFDLYHESRNWSLMEYINDPRQRNRRVSKHDPDYALSCTIPAGSALKVDRIYIRKGNSEFSSITFYWKDVCIPAHTVEEDITSWVRNKSSGHLEQVVTGKKLVKIPKTAIRFWAKLSDINKIEFDSNNI